MKMGTRSAGFRCSARYTRSFEVITDSLRDFKCNAFQLNAHSLLPFFYVTKATTGQLYPEPFITASPEKHLPESADIPEQFT